MDDDHYDGCVRGYDDGVLVGPHYAGAGRRGDDSHSASRREERTHHRSSLDHSPSSRHGRRSRSPTSRRHSGDRRSRSRSRSPHQRRSRSRSRSPPSQRRSRSPHGQRAHSPPRSSASEYRIPLTLIKTWVSANTVCGLVLPGFPIRWGFLPFLMSTNTDARTHSTSPPPLFLSLCLCSTTPTMSK